MPKRSTEIFSIFGQIEEVAAELMIKNEGARKIPAEQIPDTARYNEKGTAAKFAIILPRAKVPKFEETIKSLYA
jgi:hypothetical protein